MNTVMPQLKKRTPAPSRAGAMFARERGIAVVQLALNQYQKGSTPFARTMNNTVATGFVVVSPAAPCARQQDSLRELSSAVEHRTYTPGVTGSIPVARTSRPRRRCNYFAISLGVVQRTGRQPPKLKDIGSIPVTEAIKICSTRAINARVV